MNSSDYPLLPLVGQWVKKIRLAWERKRAEFQDDADEAMRFFDGPYDFMYGLKSARGARSFFFTGSDEGMPRPGFAMTVNKVAEMVQLFGPVLYHRNPVRQVNPRQQPMVAPELFGAVADPASQQAYQAIQMQVQQGRGTDLARAKLLEAYLNYTPTALDLKTQARFAIDEALIKGMGVLWTELTTPAGGGPRLVGSFYDSVDNLVIDPDLESLDAAKWVARRCCHPVWEVEAQYGLEPGSLRGHLASQDSQSAQQGAEDDWKRRAGITNDLVVYWKVFSKMGVGARLHGVAKGLADDLEQYGDFVHLAVCDKCDHFLNVPPALLADAQGVARALQWPTPFWADDAWPFTPLYFHNRPRQVWPMSHLKPGMGELKFINWTYSFVAGKIKNSCRDFLAIQKSASEEVKQTILHGSDYELVEIEKEHGTISEVVQFLQHPQMNGDIWRVLEAVEQNFERRVGLTELMYGQTASSFRSASEAQVKSDQLHVRPDDMANKVEDAMTDVARREAFACRWHLEPADVQPVLGDVGAYFWQQLVQAADPSVFLHQLEYRIEAGSAKKPNKARDAANMQQAVQTLFQPLFAYAQQTGDVAPVNALVGDWAKSIDLDSGKYLLQPPPPPPPAPAPGAPGAGAKSQGPPPGGK